MTWPISRSPIADWYQCMDVTDVLRDRMGEPSGLRQMAVVSVAVHVVVFAAFMLAPGNFLASQDAEPRTLMTITLGGGGEGPQNGGFTAMGGRPVQVQTPPDAPRDAVRPPAAAAPAMTVPEPGARATKASSAAVKQAPDEARGRTPTGGKETAAGSTVAMTGARGQGFGLSTGGGPGAGATLDVADFCCPEYVTTMIARIKAGWNQNQNVTGVTIIKVTILRDGTLTDIVLEQSSSFPIADLSAQRAVTLVKQLQPLPEAFPNPTLTVHLNFQYAR
jgi:TonB family protein